MKQFSKTDIEKARLNAQQKYKTELTGTVTPKPLGCLLQNKVNLMNKRFNVYKRR